MKKIISIILIVLALNCEAQKMQKIDLIETFVIVSCVSATFVTGNPMFIFIAFPSLIAERTALCIINKQKFYIIGSKRYKDNIKIN